MDFKSIALFNYLMCFAHVSSNSREISQDVIPELYMQYKEAAADESNSSLRRSFKGNKRYEIHVKKLKEVNGFKLHNLKIKEVVRNNNGPPNEYLYINNPLESKIPKAFLTLDEFKDELINRVKRQRDLLTVGNNINVSRLYKTEVDTTTRTLLSSTKPTIMKRTKQRKNKTDILTTKSNVTKNTKTGINKEKTSSLFSQTVQNIETRPTADKTLITLKKIATDINKVNKTTFSRNIKTNHSFLKTITELYNNRISYNKSKTLKVSSNFHERTKVYDNLTKSITEKNKSTIYTITETTNTKDTQPTTNTEKPTLEEITTTEQISKSTITLTDTTVEETTTEKATPKRRPTEIQSTIVTETSTASTTRLTPRRSSTFRNTFEFKGSTEKRKRITLGRPLVFLGNK